jgi:hypothetical protein
MPPVSLPGEVRAACAWVAERARFVHVEEGRIEDYVHGLPDPGAEAVEPAVGAGDPEAVAA